jgi:hypothetical protein
MSIALHFGAVSMSAFGDFSPTDQLVLPLCDEDSHFTEQFAHNRQRT